MIIGTGIDIIEISRIEAAVKKQQFVNRVYTKAEWELGSKAPHRLAGFFAAKEALLKAMGTGLAGFSWQEMEVRHNSQGAPCFKLTGKVAAYLDTLEAGRIHLSISHCREYAVALVVLEKEIK